MGNENEKKYPEELLRIIRRNLTLNMERNIYVQNALSKDYGEYIKNKSQKLNHPSYYNQPGKKECIQKMVEVFGPEAVVIFAILSAYKYDYRLGEKDNAVQDILKENWYEDYAQKNINSLMKFATKCLNAYKDDLDKLL